MSRFPIGDTFPLLPESELLVWCARTVVTDDLKACIRKRVQESLDWSVVLDMAQYHGVVPLLYRTLSAIAAELIPPESLSRLRKKTQVGVLLNRSLAQELVVLCEAFTAREVPIIPIKGATLAVLAYGDLALRDFTDLDLLIPEASIVDAQRVLLSQGYERKGDSVERSRIKDDEGPYHVYIKKRGLSRVDLQWMMAHQHFAFRLDRPEVWQRRIPVAFENHTIQGLAPEDLLIVLCVHGSKHAWELLKWVCDVAELLRAQPALDWERCFATASHWRCLRMLYMGLFLAHQLLDAPLPRMVLERLKKDSDVPALSHRMPASLLANSQDGISEEQAGALYFSLKDSWWERWSLGLTLSRAHSPLATTPPSWFRWRNSLPRLANFIIPAHRVMKRLLSPTIRGAINRLVAQSG
ncbi:MAG: nucleotidyltransferase family protein, partial [Nitrospira sp.]|nr:nucleotidyltransferase family protein [Nitrospira sp.]